MQTILLCGNEYKLSGGEIESVLISLYLTDAWK